MEKTNELIAEFMGVDHVDIDTWLETNSNLKYHTSWDWLMPVVDKIECTSTDNKDNSDNFFNVTIEVFECNINGVDADINICENGHTKRKATYNAVVKFIKWYNEKEKKA